MRFLHTSDWHLGRRLHGADLLPAQEQFLDHLIEVASRERVDAVLVAGDVYDRALPPPEAVRLLSRVLRDLVATGAQVVISAGNHDSPARLGFAAEVLELAGVHVRTDAERVTEPVQVKGVDIYPLPYLEPALVADQLGASERTHAGVMRAVAERVRGAMGEAPAVLMAHEFVAGATTSDSERDVTVGGLGVVPVSLFEPFAYTALGHLHRPQVVTGRARYCGSPVALSFSETDQAKSTLMVDLDPDGALEVREVAAPIWRPLARVRGSLAHLLSDPALSSAEEAWCEVTLTDTVRPARAMEQVRRRFPHCLSLQWAAPERVTHVRSYAERVRGRDDLDLCCDFVEHVLGRSADDAERALLTEAVAAAEVARRSRDSERGTGHGQADSAGVA